MDSFGLEDVSGGYYKIWYWWGKVSGSFGVGKMSGAFCGDCGFGGWLWLYHWLSLLS